jgi:TRAP transporter TAXI family solute receptor
VKRSLVLGFAIVLLTSPAARGVTRVTIGTGPWGGVFFPVGSALATLLNRYVADIQASAEPVEGSAHALELVHTGQLTLAIVALGSAPESGRGDAPVDKRYDNVGFVMAAMDTGQTLVTLSDSGIRTYADIKGLRVAANTPASRTLLLAALRLYGVREADVQLTFMNYAEQIAALREGTIDAGFVPVRPYNADVAGLASATTIRVLGLDATKAKAFDMARAWTSVLVKARTYRGQDADLVVPGSHTALLAHKNVDAALIYRIVKAVVDHGRAFGDLHPGGADFTVDKTRFLVEHKLVPTAFHPGAERYWREHGVLR